MGTTQMSGADVQLICTFGMPLFLVQELLLTALAVGGFFAATNVPSTPGGGPRILYDVVMPEAGTP